MEASNGDVVNPLNARASGPLLRRVESANFNRPCLDLLEDTREARNNYQLRLCVPLFKFASAGNWDEAKPLLLDHKVLLSAAIAHGWPTVLHVASGAGHFPFVKELVKLMEDNGIDQFDLQDSKGNTALSLAAIAGNFEIVKLLTEKNPFLPKIRNGTGFTPLLFAASQGKADVAKYLFPHTKDEYFEEAEWNKTFLTCIDSGIYDLALAMLSERQSLAFARDEDGMTGLHILATKAEDFGNDGPKHLNQITCSGSKRNDALELTRLLWERIIKDVESKSNIREMINRPSKLLFDATKAGNFNFLVELMDAYPDLIWEFNHQMQSIIHMTVLYRHPKIFNLIHAYSGSKDIILAYEDNDDGNNILHLAAKIAPPDRLELVSGAAFQMKLELLWFQEVKKVVQPSYMNKRNKDGYTPYELFTKEHAQLRESGQSWMKKTANSSMLVSTLITTGVLAAAFSVPGGINDASGTPNYLRKNWFKVFAIADAIAMISSSASILAFLSILTSRYAEFDFYLSLPRKLIFGLTTLFVPITSMMVAFSSAFFITYDHAINLKWIPSLISVLSFLPIAIFLCLKFKLFNDIVYSTCYLHSLFKPTKHLLLDRK